jgi:hypothetical protein
MNVKPENILVLSHGAEPPADWRFKFANFGVVVKDSERISLSQDSSSYSKRSRTA